MTTLVTSDLSTIFTVPEDDWSVISKRVGVSIALQQVFEGPGMLASFPAFLAAATTWKGSAFPSLVTQSAALVSYADTAIADFGALRSSIQQLGAGATTVPDSIKNDTRVKLQSLHASTSTLAAQFTALVPPIDALRIASDAYDAEIAASSIAQSFPPAVDQTATVAGAIGLVEGSWGSLRDDLHGTLTDVDVTMPFLASLGIEVALVAWQRIKTEAAAFAPLAAGQQDYLDGSLGWLVQGSRPVLAGQLIGIPVRGGDRPSLEERMKS
jgi:hypothetical protein